jgi:adenylyltransferase/sulfurtransferase
MLLYSALAGNAFRTVKLRSKHPKCVACTNPHFSLSDLDYVQFCGGPTPDWKVAGLASGTQDQRIYVQVSY